MDFAPYPCTHKPGAWWGADPESPPAESLDTNMVSFFFSSGEYRGTEDTRTWS